jgi:hypothetical protein
MFELYVGDVVYYATPDQRLAKDKIQSIASQKEKGRTRHIYVLANGLSKLESDLFLSLERAKAHFKHCRMEITIPAGLDNG